MTQLRVLLAVSALAANAFSLHARGETEGTSEPRQQVRLDGQYIAEIRIEGDSWQASGPQQEIALTFAASGLSSFRQLELILKLSPPSAFDLASAAFEPVAPLVTLPPGVEVSDGTQLRAGAASLTQDLVGDRILGTLTLTTSSSFNALTRAQIDVVLLSVGPRVLERETYEAQQLNLGVVVNWPPTSVTPESWGEVKSQLRQDRRGGGANPGRWQPVRP